MVKGLDAYDSEPLDTAALHLPLGESEVKAEIRRLFGV